MDMQYIAAGVSALSMLGSSIGLSMLFNGYFNASARQPIMADKLRGMLMIGMALIEAMGLFAFVLAIILINSK